jgi:hypothetical protein
MPIQILERPKTAEVKYVREAKSDQFEPNFGPEDMHAIRAIFGIMVGILTVALVMYATITICVW